MPQQEASAISSFIMAVQRQHLQIQHVVGGLEGAWKVAQGHFNGTFSDQTWTECVFLAAFVV